MKHFSLFALAAGLCGSAHAADGVIGPFVLASASEIGEPVGLQVAGNFEVALTKNFPVPPGMSCPDAVHLTTLRSSDPDREMFHVLEQARRYGMQVTLYITDDTTRTAYPKRCSITAVELGAATPLLPVCTSFTPTSGLIGTNVTITGKNFADVISVKFGAVPAAKVTVTSTTTIKTVVPDRTKVGNSSIEVTTASGTSTCPGSFNMGD